MPVLLNEQKYKNNIRTVSGSVIVFDDDVILAVDTSVGSCTIDLGIIPAQNWSTLYKLYVYDISGNALANNIVINAAAGQTINGSSSFTINVNGGGVIIRILGQNRYGASATFSTGGGMNGHIIEDEGTALPQQPTLNFVGAGVTAFDDPLNNETVVQISGGIIPITNINLLTLINTNTVVSGQLYQVTDAIFITTYFATQETAPVIIKGISNNSVSLEGSGIFLNADYQQIGNYSSVVGFGTNVGVWNTTLVAAIGDVAMWHNKHFVNNTGINTPNNPDLDLVNWTELPKSTTNGYIQEIDFVTYDVYENVIRTRLDKRNNYIENNFAANGKRLQTFDVFQWGNNKVAFNKVIENSVFLCYQNQVIGGALVRINDLGIYQNIVQNESDIALDLDGNYGVIKNNVVSGVDCEMQFVGVNKGSVNANFVMDSRFQLGTMDAPDTISKNHIFNSSLVVQIVNTLSGFIDNNIINSDVRINSHKGLFNRNTINDSSINIDILDVGGQFQENFFFNSQFTGSKFLQCQTLNANVLRNTFDNSFLKVDRFIADCVMTDNEVRQNSQIDITDLAGSFTFNQIFNNSSVIIETMGGVFGKGAKGTGNRIDNKSEVSILTHNGIIENSVLDRGTKITINDLCLGNMNNIQFMTIGVLCDQFLGSFNNITTDYGYINSLIINRDYQNGSCARKSRNTIQVELDLSDPTIYDVALKKLTIPDDVIDFAGLWLLTNAAGQQIDLIRGMSQEFLTEIYCNTNTVQFNAIAVAPFVADTIVANAIGAYIIKGKTLPDLADSLLFKSTTFRHGIIEANIFA